MIVIDFDCQKCIHYPVCSLKDEAKAVIESHNENIEGKIFKLTMTCKYFGHINNSLIRNEVK